MSIPLTVDSLAGGGAVERLHRAIDEALENILDPNTAAKKTRTVTLKMTIKPNEQRNMGEVTVATSVALCPPQPLETSIIIDKDRTGRAVASELMTGESPGSVPLPDMHPDGKITIIERKQA